MAVNNQIIYCNIPRHEQPESFGMVYMPAKEWIKKHSKNSSYVVRIPYSDTLECNEILFLDKFKNTYLFIDNTLEGYTWQNFKHIYNFTIKTNIKNRVIYGASETNIELEYNEWLKENNLDKIFSVYYNSNWYFRIKDNITEYKYNFDIDKSQWFCCLNNRPHTHRCKTVVYLDYLDLLKHGKVSSLDKFYDAENIVTFENNAVSYLDKDSEYYHIINSHVAVTKSKLPLNIDTIDYTNGSRPHDMNPEIYNTCLINLTTETFYNEFFNKYSHLFISEKTWKPIIAKQLFIIIGPKGILKYLNSIGFKTFHEFIDESYDNLDSNSRLFAAVESLNSAINKYSIEELNSLTKEIREYNYRHFVTNAVQYLCPPIGNLACI